MPYDDTFKEQVLTHYKNNTAKETASKYKVHILSVYRWAKEKGIAKRNLNVKAPVKAASKHTGTTTITKIPSSSKQLTQENNALKKQVKQLTASLSRVQNISDTAMQRLAGQ